MRTILYLIQKISTYYMEMMDIVNEKDEIIGKASREEVYSQRLAHRIVHIIIFNNVGKIALQLRSKKVKFCPLYWSTSVGGHVRSGENYEEAALRELHEELGIKARIDLVYKDVYKDERGFTKILSTFKMLNNGPFKINHDEVEKIEFFSIKDIREMISRKENMHPELLFLLKKHILFSPDHPIM
jgi:isopentenyldiphosphate isomerase